MRVALLWWLQLCCFVPAIGGQCLIGLAQAKPFALGFFESLAEQKFTATTINPANSGNKETTRQLVLQFIHQSLDKLINKQWCQNDPDRQLWCRLMSFHEPEPLVDLLACLDQFATGHQRQCKHLAALADLCTGTKNTWLGSFLDDLLESASESCANNRVALLDSSIANCPDLDRQVDSMIDALVVAPTSHNETSIKPLMDDWQRAELIGQLSHDLATMNGTQLEGICRRSLAQTDGGQVSLVGFCAYKLQQSEPIRLADMGEALVKVDKFRSSLLTNISLDGKSRKWIQLWLLCHKLHNHYNNLSSY